MILSVTLSSPDPMREILNFLPSRKMTSSEMNMTSLRARHGSTLGADLKHVNDNIHDLRRLSSVTQVLEGKVFLVMDMGIWDFDIYCIA